MRVAVSLPTLPPGAPHRTRLDAALAALADTGIEIEAFAERPRDRDGADPFPVFHYLRLPERHEDEPFDTGLTPLGRDMRAWEPPYLQMHAWPGAVWVLDPVVHHLLIGGLLAWGHWDEYRDTLEAEFGDETGAIMAHTVAGGWGVDALYRERDPLLRRCARQPAVCGATPAIVRALERAGASAKLVRLPAPEPVSDRPSARRILVLRLNYSWPQPALRALGEVLREQRDIELMICVPEVVQRTGLRFPPDHEWLEERVRWVEPGNWPSLIDAVDTSGVVIHLLADPTVGERALVERAMAAGSVPLLLRAEGWDDYATGTSIGIEPGRAQERALALSVRALLDDPELADAIGGAARCSVAERADARATAEALVPILERSAETGFRRRDLGRSTWAQLASSVSAKVGPECASRDLQELIESRRDRVFPSDVVRRLVDDGA